jgi:hypothetical protein
VRLWKAVFLIVFVAVGFLAARLAAKSPLGLIILKGKVPASWLVDNLSSSDRLLVTTSIELLRDRRSPAGQEKAREMLGSTDDYIWLSAATYLGCLGDRESIPWLIRSLRHPALSVDRRAAYLEELTTQQFGRKQELWIDWWRKEHPDSTFSFRNQKLEEEAARLRGGGLLINAVLDAVTISHCGPTIRLIGVRPVRGPYDEEAIQTLKTLVMNQFVQLRYDRGPHLDERGSRRAFVYWNNQGEAGSVLRVGLPPVPFAKLPGINSVTVPFAEKPLINRRLLDSGLYEPDLESVDDAEMRKDLVKGMAERR